MKKLKMKNLWIIVNSIFILTVFFFLLDELTPIDIKNQALKSFSYFGFLILTPVMLIWNFLIYKKSRKNVIILALPTLACMSILFINPMKIIYSVSAWKTQTVLYQNGHLNFKKVEFQMQDIGALGYNKRTVEVLYLTKLLILTNPIEKDIDKKVEWLKVDKDVNEMGLKN